MARWFERQPDGVTYRLNDGQILRFEHLLALQLDNVQDRMEQMAQTIDELKATVQQLIATMTTDVSTITAAIADLKQQIADLKGAPPAPVDFQPEVDAFNAQLSLLEKAAADAKA